MFELDHAFVTLLQLHRFEALDHVVSIFTTATTYVSIAVILILLVRWFRGKSHLDLRRFLFQTGAFAFSVVASNGLKLIFRRDRPFVTYEDIIKLGEGGGFSFPSGHSSEAWTMAFTFAVLFPKSRLKFVFFLWATAVSYSRIVLGVHYPSDVAGGILLGIIIAGAVYFLNKQNQMRLTQSSKSTKSRP